MAILTTLGSHPPTLPNPGQSQSWRAWPANRDEPDTRPGGRPPRQPTVPESNRSRDDLCWRDAILERGPAVMRDGGRTVRDGGRGRDPRVCVSHVASRSPVEFARDWDGVRRVTV
jgi:hypothetical protein